MLIKSVCSLKISRLGSLILLACLPSLASAQDMDRTDKIKSIQNSIREWVEIEKQISKEYNEWLFEKELLEEAIVLLEEEKESLEEAIADAEQSTSAAERRRLELLEEKDALQAASDALAERIGGYEEKLLGLVVRFPEPLQKEIAALIKRIPEPGSETEVALTVRLQNIVGVMNEVDKFNSGPTHVAEIRTIETPEGTREAQVTTLYFGLAHAYFVDSQGVYGGTGLPSEDGWIWEVDSSLAPEIAQLVAVAKNEEQAVFSNLPITIVD